jgi:lactate permease
LYAVAMPLIGHAWANMFGAFAVGWLATLQVVELSNPAETAFQTAILLWTPNLLAGFAIAWLYGRWAAVRHAWPLVLIVSAVHGGLQLALTLWEPVLSTFLATSVALVLLRPLSRWRRYSEPAEDIEERPAMQDGLDGTGEISKEEPRPVMGLGMALLPYGVFAVVTMVALMISTAGTAPERLGVGPPFPEEETGFGVVNEAEEPYSPFTPLTHPGTFLLVGALTGYVVYRVRGYYHTRNEREETQGIWAGLVGDAAPASIAIVAFLATSGIMKETGQTDVLALGISEVLPPVAFTFLSNLIGGLGAFMTFGNTTSNVLFAPLQQTVAAAGGLSEATIIAAQSSGGAVGTAVAPANVALGMGAVGTAGQEGDVLRRVLPWAAVVALTTGGATVLLNNLTFL